MKSTRTYMPIKAWSSTDQPREKLILKGASVLTDAELLAILIGSGTKEQSAVDLSRKILLSAENNLDVLSKKGVKELMKHKGIGEAKAISIVACMELSRRRNVKSTGVVKAVTCSRDAYDLIGPQIMDLQHEEFWILLLNRGMRLIKKVQIGQGGVSGVVADKKIIFKHALEHLASAIILVHNHPSGRIVPSQQDDILTQSLVASGKLLDIKIADHLIIGGKSYYSYLDEGRV